MKCFMAILIIHLVFGKTFSSKTSSINKLSSIHLAQDDKLACKKLCPKPKYLDASCNCICPMIKCRSSLPFVNPDTCTCECRAEEVEKSCINMQNFNQTTCACECEAQMWVKCRDFSPKYCKCGCREQDEENCKKNQFFNTTSCACQKNPKKQICFGIWTKSWVLEDVI